MSKKLTNILKVQSRDIVRGCLNGDKKASQAVTDRQTVINALVKSEKVKR